MFKFSSLKEAYQVFKHRQILIKALFVFFLLFVVYVGAASALKIVMIKNEIKSGAFIGHSNDLQNTVAIRGQGKIDAKPDLAIVNLGVRTESLDIAKAQADNAKKMNKIVDYLKKLGISEKDLKTTGYNIWPRYEYQEGTGKRRLAGYEIYQNLNVKIRDFANIGKVLSEVTNLGANEISDLFFDIDDLSKAQDVARNKAIEDAKNKAKILGNQLGIKLDKIIGFNEFSGSYPVYRDWGIGGGGKGIAQEALMPVAEPGTNEINLEVELIYRLDR